MACACSTSCSFPTHLAIALMSDEFAALMSRFFSFMSVDIAAGSTCLLINCGFVGCTASTTSTSLCSSAGFALATPYVTQCAKGCARSSGDTLSTSDSQASSAAPRTFSFVDPIPAASFGTSVLSAGAAPSRIEGKISVSVSSACDETFELESPSVGVNASNILVVARSVNDAELARLATCSSFLRPSSRSVQSLDLSLANAGASASRSLPPLPSGGLPSREAAGVDLAARALNASIILADPSSPPLFARAMGLRACGFASGSGAGETRPLSSAPSFPEPLAKLPRRPNLCCERR
mmetsp:Transcript_1805/g.8081  ORF Transcript_1805/g.8081 Transcript_1805/m.8081 type:complete len:295 (+) Transcript_1805:179-1063(+)